MFAMHASYASEPMPVALETVTVWAQKREMTLQEVPMAVSALGAEDIAAAGIDNIADIADLVPALDLQRSVGPVTTTLRIRRVGNLGNIPTFESAVGLFVDGAFRSRSLLSAADLLDVDRVEVLHGPQSVLYGKNVSAGVVAVHTREPAGQRRGELEFTEGVIDVKGTPRSYRASATLSGPLAETLGGSMALAYSGHDTTLTNALDAPDGNEQSRTTARAQLAWRAGEQLRLRLIAGYLRERDDQGESDVYLAPGARSSGIAAALQQLGAGSICPDNLPHDRTSCSVATNHVDLEATDLTLLANYRFANGWSLDSITAWDRYEDRRSEDDLVQLFTPLLFFHDSERGDSFQEELRLTSADHGPVSWLAGLSYYANDYSRGNEPMFGPNGPAAYLPFWTGALGMPLAVPDQLGLHESRLDTDYVSVFGQLTWPLTRRLSVTAGARWQQEDKKGSIHNSVTVQGASIVSTVLAPAMSPSGEPVNGAVARSTDNVSWSVTPQYLFNDSLMTYVTIAAGFRSGGFNTGFGNAPLRLREFGDETSTHYEAGLRARLADGRARLSLNTFYTRYMDYQDAAFISSQFTIGNAARVDLQGAELEGRIALGNHTLLNLAISYADLVYETNTTGMCHPGRAPDGSLPRSCDLSGEHPVDAPPWSVSAGIQYTRDVPWGNISGRLDWSWTDRYNSSFSADARLWRQPYHDLGIRLGTRFGAAAEVIVWGDNLLDEKIVHFDSVLNLFNDASYQSFLGDARSCGLTLRLHF